MTLVSVSVASLYCCAGITDRRSATGRATPRDDRRISGSLHCLLVWRIQKFLHGPTLRLTATAGVDVVRVPVCGVGARLSLGKLFGNEGKAKERG